MSGCAGCANAPPQASASDSAIRQIINHACDLRVRCAFIPLRWIDVLVTRWPGSESQPCIEEQGAPDAVASGEDVFLVPWMQQVETRQRDLQFPGHSPA